jgi:hypothetical protein
MCPSFSLLRTYKVYPRKIDFNYIKDRFFIYIYLDPFKELTKPLQIVVGSKEICFGYEPFYVGKGTGSGYRQHQHLKEFFDKREINRYKVEKLAEIETNMAKAAAKGDV